MKAIVCEQFGDPRKVAQVKEVANPAPPGPGQVSIQVQAASVSHATELLIRGSYQSNPPLPFSPGTEVYGQVLACGEDVSTFEPGDHVVAMTRWGGYAQQINLPTHTAYRVLDGLSMQQALPLPLSYGTAYTALVWKAHMTPEDTVLILGAGSGVGLAAVEIASALGATVIAVASSADKRDVAQKHGAHYTFAPDNDLVSNIKACSGGASIIFDPVGAELMETAFKAAAQGAQILSIGFAAGRPPRLPQNIMLVKNLSLHGFFYGQYIGWTPHDERLRYETPMRNMMRTLQHMTLRGQIRPEIVKTYPMDGLCQALDDLGSRRITGKVALTLTGDTQ